MFWSTLHLVAVGVWLGCLATEIAFEKAMGTEAAIRQWVSALHDKVDRWVEGPAFVAVAISGAVLLGRTPWTPGLAIKVALGLGAVIANVWCLHLVLARQRAARAGIGPAWVDIDRRQHKWGTAVVVLLLATLLAAAIRAVTG